MSKAFIAALAALLGATAAQAQYYGTPPASGYARLSYTYADARLLLQDPDGADDADGIRLGASGLIHPDFFVTGALGTTGSDGPNGLDTDVIELHLGYRYAFTPHVDLLGMAGIVHVDRDFGGRRDDDDLGPSLTGGFRAPLASMVEVAGFANYTQVFGDGDLSLRGEGLYHVTPNFSAVAGLALSDDLREASLGVRWTFAPTR